MKKSILSLEGVEVLSKNQQKMTTGGDGKNPSLCQEPLIICENGRTWDPCAPRNFGKTPCNF